MKDRKEWELERRDSGQVLIRHQCKATEAYSFRPNPKQAGECPRCRKAVPPGWWIAALTAKFSGTGFPTG